MRVSLTLPNRGVLFGVTTVDEMLHLAEQADRTGLFDTIWVGDSLLGKPRLESVALLSALAGRTRQVKLGPACMASFPLRDPVLLAYQWASLDLISNGRSVLVACTGLVEQEGAQVESALYGLENRDRVKRLIEWIKILRLLWSQDGASFEGDQYRFSGLTIEPKPVARPYPPIWIANNARGNRELIVRTLRRAARHADGWQTSIFDLDDLAWRIPELKSQVAAAGKDPASYPVSIYHNININEDRQAALEESQRFLETYYQPTRYSVEEVSDWVALGSPDECVEHLLKLRDLGATEVGLRITSWNQRAQYERLVDEVVPRLYAATAGAAS
jgi:alkanesulfonate monooxygenase SsuD/methylene tetrahydromethanopterin reductase-like flavin-dependent oxidoreductase (luciferase family)